MRVCMLVTGPPIVKGALYQSICHGLAVNYLGSHLLSSRIFSGGHRSYLMPFIFRGNIRILAAGPQLVGRARLWPYGLMALWRCVIA